MWTACPMGCLLNYSRLFSSVAGVGTRNLMTDAMHGFRCPLDEAIAFEEYRLQILARWPDSDTKQDMVVRIGQTLQRLREERLRMRRTHPPV